MMGPERYRRECEGNFVFEYPPKFIKWYERKAHKYARRYLTSTADERKKMAYADWCEDYK